jgi:hypothetical protein
MSLGLRLARGAGAGLGGEVGVDEELCECEGRLSLTWMVACGRFGGDCRERGGPARDLVIVLMLERLPPSWVVHWVR